MGVVLYVQTKLIGDASTQQCKTVCLDDYVKKYNLKVGLIKTDVEGFEQQHFWWCNKYYKRTKTYTFD